MGSEMCIRDRWYEFDGERIWFVGRDYSGVAFVQRRNSLPVIMNDYDIACLTHLPDCTGWDWEPETFPQYYKAVQDAAFVRRDSPTQSVAVWRSGAEEFMPSPFDPKRYTQRLTEAEALALLGKPNQPAEDPEEWVIQDQVPARAGIDEFRWSCWQGYHFHVVQDHNIACGMKHGQGHEGSTLSVRCRRKDLPKPRCTVTVPKWLVVYSDGKVGVYETDSKPRVDSVHKEVHRVGETTYEI